MPDRSGGREVKGASLKQSKKNPGCPKAQQKKVAKSEPSGPSYSLPPPPPRRRRFLDCSAAILSRQFDRDRDRVISRAEAEQVTAILCWFSDIEKLPALVDLAKSNPSFCYYLAGAHPDNVDKTNKKSHDGWLEKVEDAGRKPECLGILSGLNLTREMATHFSQESLLKASCIVADKLLLPLIIHVAPDGDSLEKVIEVLRSVGWTPDSDSAIEATGAHRILLYDSIAACMGDIDKLQHAIEAGFHFLVSASGLTEGDTLTRERAQQVIRQIPLERLLVCSDSPWKTPQNIPDAYIRSQRNEPSNLAFVLQAIHESMETELSLDEFTEQVQSNSFSFFGLEFLTDEQVHTVFALETRQHQQEEMISPPRAVKAGVGSRAKAVRAELSEAKNALQTAVEYFGCPKCRNRLFCPEDVTNHSLDAAKTIIFKVGEEGLCQTVIFLNCENEDDIFTRTGLSIRGGNVECSECHSKFGRFYPGEAYCACGVSMHGPSARLIASKMDFFDGVRDAEVLAARAQTEAEEWDRMAELEDQDANDRQKVRKGTKARVKQKSERGKGNFSDFRNKTFITPGLKNKVARNDNNEFKKMPTWGKKHRVSGGGAKTGEEGGEDEGNCDMEEDLTQEFVDDQVGEDSSEEDNEDDEEEEATEEGANDI